MAKLWAKPFYNSKAWQDCRDGYFNLRFGLCELCDKPGEEVHHKIFLTPENINNENITLNWDNLQLLCKKCHNAVHERAYEMHRIKTRNKTSTDNSLCFSESGDLVLKKNVVIVYGAPASGKTTYVKENKGKYDIVVDLDSIINALSLNDLCNKKLNTDALPFAFDVRDLLYELIEKRKHYFETAWVIAMLPKKEERERLREKLHAELIYINADEAACLNRARVDESRIDKETQYQIIKKYFNELET